VQATGSLPTDVVHARTAAGDDAYEMYLARFNLVSRYTVVDLETAYRLCFRPSSRQGLTIEDGGVWGWGVVN